MNGFTAKLILLAALLPLLIPSAHAIAQESGNSEYFHRLPAYLMRNLQENGRFYYLRYPGEAARDDGKYNILRHAGTIYSLGMYNQDYPGADIVASMESASGYMKECCLAGPERPEEGDWLAVWSSPEIATNVRERKAKLGGAALGLIALLSLEKEKPGATGDETLRALGRFLVFMQRPDGSFVSRYIGDKGKDDEFESLYYPGEAALALAMLFEHDGKPLWLESAVKALSYLAESRKEACSVPADHWALIATGEIFRHSFWPVSAESRELLYGHAMQLASSIIGELENPAFLADGGHTTKVATRLEGLFAIYPFIREEDKALKVRLELVAAKGIAFLDNSIIVDGDLEGGVPARYLIEAASGKRSERAVRIDYVQHALSAFIVHKRLFAGQGESE